MDELSHYCANLQTGQFEKKSNQKQNEETWLLYRRARYNVTEMIKCSKRQYYENSIHESRIIYKGKGSKDDAGNYRPISLIAIS